MNNKIESPKIDFVDLKARVRRFVAGKIRQKDDIDDVVQEALTRTAQYTDFRNIDSPTGYVIQVAKSVLVEHYRFHSKTEHTEDGRDLLDQLVSPEDLERQLIDEQKLDVIQTTLRQMPELRRQVFIRRKLDGLSREQIAEELNLSVEAVKKHINRATVSLTLALQKHGLLDV